MDKKRRTMIPCARTERDARVVLKKDDPRKRRREKTPTRRSRKPPAVPILYLSDDDVKRTLCAGCSANTSILCSIAAKYASISVMCPTLLAASRTSSVFSAGSRRCSFKVVVSSVSTAVGDASPALFVFECWCLIASAENTPGLKNNATIIVIARSVILFEITEDCRRRIHDDLILFSSKGFVYYYVVRAVLCVGGCLSFPAGRLKKSKCYPKHFGSKNEKRNLFSCTKKISHVILN